MIVERWRAADARQTEWRAEGVVRERLAAHAFPSIDSALHAASDATRNAEIVS